MHDVLGMLRKQLGYSRCRLVDDAAHGALGSGLVAHPDRVSDFVASRATLRDTSVITLLAKLALHNCYPRLY